MYNFQIFDPAFDSHSSFLFELSKNIPSSKVIDARKIGETRANGTPSSLNLPARVNTMEANTKNKN